MITFDDFKKIEMTVGEILAAEKVPETDKLLRLTVDFKEEVPRQIISGISMYFPNENDLVGKRCMFVTNLEPRTIRGLESQGMVLVVIDQGRAVCLHPEKEVAPGSEVR